MLKMSLRRLVYVISLRKRMLLTYLLIDFTFTCIQLFRQRLSIKAYATIPKGNLGNTQ